jgi:hypothetical protein
MDDNALAAYLLGRSPADQRAQLDELSVTDAAMAERLIAVEQDLADAYVRGELDAEDRRRWEHTYLASAEGRDQARFAHALLSHRRPAAARGSWTWGLAAAAAVVLVAGSTYVAMRTRAPAVPVQTTEHAPSAPAASPSPAAPAEAPQRRIVAMTLEIPTRSIQQTPVLRIPRGTEDVKLTLTLEPNPFGTFTARLRDQPSGDVEWQASGLTASRGAGTLTLELTLPAKVFSTSPHAIEVAGERGRARDVIAVYPLNVVLQ